MWRSVPTLQEGKAQAQSAWHTWLKPVSFREAWLTRTASPQCLFCHQTELPTPSTCSSTSAAGPVFRLFTLCPPTLPHLPLLLSSRKSLLIVQLFPTDSTRQNSLNSHLNTTSSRGPHVNGTVFSFKIPVLGAYLCCHNLLSLRDKEQWSFSISVFHSCRCQ